jgi:hypothetical protein
VVFRTFSTVYHPPFSADQAVLAHSVQEAWLQKHFSLVVTKPWNRATEVALNGYFIYFLFRVEYVC